MPKLLLKNGRVIDPSRDLDETTDVLVVDLLIQKVGPCSPDSETNVIDCAGKLVVPGLVDMHVHLRDMEQAHKETVETGTKAARRGGVTTLLAMPNTRPPLDGREPIRQYQELLKDARVRVYLAGAVTKGLGNEALAELEAYPELGIHVITNDGVDVGRDDLLEEAMKKANALDLLFMAHAEMMNMAEGAPINQGPVSDRLGVAGAPKEKEFRAVARILAMALKTGARAHLTHLSCAESVDLVRQAKQKSDRITCDATPHHFALTEEAVLRHGSRAKVNPPLRSETDRQAVLEGLKDGTIDAIVTDHAPHHARETGSDLTASAFGFSGLETLLPATLSVLHQKERLALPEIFAKLTSAPARILGIRAGTLAEGRDADITVIDPDAERTVDPARFVSLGQNTPFAGETFTGWPVMTIVKGGLYQAN